MSLLIYEDYSIQETEVVKSYPQDQNTINAGVLGHLIPLHIATLVFQTLLCTYNFVRDICL